MRRISIVKGWASALAVGAAACSGGATPGEEPSAATVATVSEPMHAHGRVAQRVVETDLVSDQPGAAAMTDAHLVNAWGLAFNPTAGFPWVSDNGAGVTTVYDATGARKLTVTIPGLGDEASAPTGQVFNEDASAFDGDRFLFVTEDGTISGWQPSDGAQATMRVDASASGAVYKGVTLARGCDGALRLYATNFHAGSVDVFDASYAPTTVAGSFRDRGIPAGYAPFNVQEAWGLLVVTFAQQDADKHDDVKGPGHGFVDLFTPEGRLVDRLVSRGALDSPWGIAVAPRGFGRIAGRLLVGNFGDGRIHAYEIEPRRFHLHVEHEGALARADGSPLVIDGLWALRFAPEAGGFHADQLFFTAGPSDEQHGLFGRLEAR